MQAVIDFKPNALNLQLLKYKIDQSNIENSEELKFYLKNPKQLSIDRKIVVTYKGNPKEIKLNLDHLKVELKNKKYNLDSKLNLAAEVLRNIHLDQFPIKEKNDQRTERKTPLDESKSIDNVKVEPPVRISPKESWRLLVTNTKIPDGQHYVEWSKMKFGDGFISVGILGHVLSLHSISSKEYLNNIKDKYNFS